MKTIMLCFVFIFQSIILLGQNASTLKRTQQKQEKVIKAAFKRGKVTAREYEKLMTEQKTIKRYIYWADKDKYWSSAEQLRIKGKLDRAEARLKRYKTNSEDY